MRNKLGSSLVNSWMNKLSQQMIYEFDDFRVDAGHLILSCNQEEINLAPKAIETLLALIERRGEVVSKDELLEAVWPDTIVDESNLFSYLSHLRKALGNRNDGRPYVETLRRRGYRFTGDVKVIAETKATIPAEVLPTATNGQRVTGTNIPTKNTGSVVALAEWLREGPEREETKVEKSPTEDNDSVPGHVKRVRSRALLVSTSLGVLILGSMGIFLWRSTSRSADASIKTIAVLPCKPLTAGSRNEIFELGMADNLISRLNSTGEINAWPLSSVRKYADDNRDAVVIGRELGVDYILETYLQTSDDEIRVSAKLFSTANGREVWGRPFNESRANIFGIQDAIAERVATELRPQLSESAKSRLTKHGTENPEAYGRYVWGRIHVSRLILPETQKGISYLNEAIALDPNYAPAYVEIANAYRAQALTSDLPASEVLPKSKEAALKALEIDETLAEAHVAAGQAAMWFDRNWEEAEKQANSALELEPNNAAAMYLLEGLNSFRGRHEDAAAFGKKARELDPLSLIYNAIEAQTLLYAGHIDEALERATTTVELDRTFWNAHLVLAMIYTEKGTYENAIAEADIAAQLSRGNSIALALKGYALAKSGNTIEARNVLDELLKQSRERNVPASSIALIYNGLGDKEESLKHLEKGFDEGNIQMIRLKTDPKWDNLRSEPRFIELMRKMNFE